MGRIWLAWNKGSEASKGGRGPEVIPPEHTRPETERKPCNGDEGRDEEEGQSGDWGRRG